VPCTNAHNAEVFETFVMSGSTYPGDSAIKAEASAKCTAKLAATVKEADRKNLQLGIFNPLSDSWQRGEHGVTCVAVQKSGTVTRSILAG
jgi:hydroxypyruvate isomerase